MAKHRAPAPRAQRGETLVEVLIALLIVALSTLLLAAMVMTSGSVNIIARQKDEAFYEALSKVEAMDSGTPDLTSTPETVQIAPDPGNPTSGSNKEIGVTVYSADGLAFYKK